jgi:hypothetical protein
VRSDVETNLRHWFADLGDALATVEAGGEPLLARAEDVDSMASIETSDVVRLRPAFDQFVLGAGTGDPHLVPAHHRAEVSRAAGSRRDLPAQARRGRE